MPGGGSRCREAENYGPMLARHFAKAIMDEEDVHGQTYAAEDADTGVLRRLATQHGSHAARVAQRLHQNVGRPRKKYS